VNIFDDNDEEGDTFSPIKVGKAPRLDNVTLLIHPYLINLCIGSKLIEANDTR
jgi:hypothetical protein